jgi:ribonuclease P protein component
VDQRLRPSERLNRQLEFRAAFDQGRRTHGRFMTVMVRPNRLPIARLGVVASRKIGGAVQRNRAKRLVRTLFRRHKQAPYAVGRDIVVIPRRDLLGAAFSALEADYESVLRRDQQRSR